MKLYKIELKESDITWDSYTDHVIIANSEKEVIDMAKNISQDEGPKVWNFAKITYHGNYTGFESNPFILLSNYRAG